jgi:hypothetical protein
MHRKMLRRNQILPNYRLLSRLGLTPDKSLLVEQSREGAISILSDLLWKGQAYLGENMPKEVANSIATKIVSENVSATSRYFSNKDSPISDTLRLRTQPSALELLFPIIGDILHLV